MLKIFNQEPGNFLPEDISILRQLGVYAEAGDSSDERQAIIDFQPDVLFTRLGFSVDKNLVSRLVQIKYVVTCTTGLNHIDLNACHDRGIQVLSLKGEAEFLKTVTSTAEHTWFLLLATLRRSELVRSKLRSGLWSRKDYYCSQARSKTLGIIGYGRLGKILARYARAFELRLLINDTNEEQMDAVEYECRSDLSKLLSNSDIVCLMIDYSMDNELFFGADQFAAMKRGSIFINASRGELVDEASLIQSLESGQLSAAGLDVLAGDSTWDESIPENNAVFAYFRSNENLVLTPHIGGHAIEAIHDTRSFMVSKLRSSLSS